MKSHLTRDFMACFGKLPARIKRLARKNYRLWETNPDHPSLQFRRVGRKYPAYSVRVGLGVEGPRGQAGRRDGMVLDRIPRRIRQAAQRIVASAQCADRTARACARPLVRISLGDAK